MSRSICRQCRYYHHHYGNKNKKGERVISRNWCIQKGITIVRIPKKCEFFKAKQE